MNKDINIVILSNGDDKDENNSSKIWWNLLNK